MKYDIESLTKKLNDINSERDILNDNLRQTIDNIKEKEQWDKSPHANCRCNYSYNDVLLKFYTKNIIPDKISCFFYFSYRNI